MAIKVAVTPERQPRLFYAEENSTSSDMSGPNVVSRVEESVDDFRAAITALAPWFGANRMLGPEVGRQLQVCEWVGTGLFATRLSANASSFPEATRSALEATE